MSFSPDGKFLLSVSRDRKWCLFGVKEDGKLYELLSTSDAKNNLHTRVIWCCAWTTDSLHFATGSRDGKIGIWTLIKTKQEASKITVICAASLDFLKESITALAFAPIMRNSFHILAIGFENGSISLYRFSETTVESLGVVFQGDMGHDLAVKRLAFRPKPGLTGVKTESKDQNIVQLASCGSDHVIKIYNLYWKS